MGRKFKKHKFPQLTLVKPPLEEEINTWNGNFPLNTANLDRISFSVWRNKNGIIRKIENISYDIFVISIDDWITLVRYDDHGGMGILHKHIKFALNNEREIITSDWVTKTTNKNKQFRWAYKDIKNNHSSYREKFCKNSGIDLY